MNKEQKQIIKQWREVNNQYMDNKRYEEKAALQDSNKARMYEEKKKQKHKQIIIKDHQYEINADGTETDIERYGKGEINE